MKKLSETKKILIFLALLLIAYFIFSKHKEEVVPVTETPKQEEETTKTPVKEVIDTDKLLFDEIADSEIFVPDQDAKVSLENGYGEFEIPETTIEGFVRLESVYTVVDKNSKQNFFGVVSVSPSGSGIFQYLVWYEKAAGKISPISYIFLGDRIAIDKVSTKEVSGETEVTLETRERKEGAPMTEEPTLKKTRIFSTSGNALSEK